MIQILNIDKEIEKICKNFKKDLIKELKRVNKEIKNNKMKDKSEINATNNILYILNVVNEIYLKKFKKVDYGNLYLCKTTSEINKKKNIYLFMPTILIDEKDLPFGVYFFITIKSLENNEISFYKIVERNFENKNLFKVEILDKENLYDKDDLKYLEYSIKYINQNEGK